MIAALFENGRSLTCTAASAVQNMPDGFGGEGALAVFGAAALTVAAPGYAAWI